MTNKEPEPPKTDETPANLGPDVSFLFQTSVWRSRSSEQGETIIECVPGYDFLRIFLTGLGVPLCSMECMHLVSVLSQPR